MSAPNVFVLDDNPTVLTSLSRLLRSARLNVVTFNSPAEFLQRTAALAPDCLVLDIAMPGMNGLELQELLKSKGSTLPIVFLTAHGDSAMRAMAMERGAVAFLSKPVNDEDLLNAVHLAIEQNPGGRHERARPIHTEQPPVSSERKDNDTTHSISGELNHARAAHPGTAGKAILVRYARVIPRMKRQLLARLLPSAAKPTLG